MAGNEMALSLAFRAKTQVWTTIGMWAWILHRLTGLGLVLYIFIHIVLMSLSLLLGQKAFDSMLSLLMGHPFFEVLDTLLLVDLGVGIGVRSQKAIFWVFMAIAVILWLWSIAVKF